MTERIQAMRSFLRSGSHHQYRRYGEFTPPDRYAAEGLCHMERVTRAFEEMLAQETPLVLPDDRILFWRTVKNLPELLTEEEWSGVRSKHYIRGMAVRAKSDTGGHFIHEAGRVCNISPNYASIISGGLLPVKQKAQESMSAAADEEQALFYRCVVQSIDAALDLTERYRTAAQKAGNTEAAAVLERVPARGARTFREALQSLRILQYALWCEGEYHNTLGRFDQYMFPYFRADLAAGRLTEDSAFELLEEFFLSLNRDSDLYPGIQQGDNGQSLMLGGVDRDGNSCFNQLSELCLDASRELLLIDPKINLRVDKNTPLSIYEKGTLLTREGLGFPQYSNDDIVIPGLVRKGYDLTDARDYTVAACWEFIIPGVGMDIPNIAAVNFPKLVTDAVLEDLESAASYNDFFAQIGERLAKTCRELCDGVRSVYMLPAPFMSVLMDGCVEQGRDISYGSKYNNYGFHGVGLSTAVDSLYTVKRLVFEEGELSPADARALILDSAEDNPLLPRLRYELPKFGDDDDGVDNIAVELMDAFADAVEPLQGDRGGCVRVGTGSAMYYLWYAKNVGNTLSGHRQGESFSANYAPELFVKSKGPLSVIRSFTKPHLERVCNGGPLTMEFHASIFRDADSIRKVASLVRAFVQSGGHQLQLNSINNDTLLDAQAHPEQYRNLIVRVWGWSAYFTELDREYQNHVISRQQYVI